MNSAHGILNGCSINHNKTPLITTNIEYGFNINACLFYCGEINIKNSRFIKFFGCDLSNLKIFTEDSKECYAWN